MYFARVLIRKAHQRTGWSHFSLLKSMAIRYIEHKVPQPIPFKYRLMVFLRITAAILSLPFRLRKTQATVLMLNVVKPLHDQRRYFLRKYMDDGLLDEQVASYSPYNWNDKLIYRRMDWQTVRRLFVLSWDLWRAALGELFRSSKTLPFWHMLAVQLAFQEVLFHGKDTRIVHFLFFYPQHYIASLYVTSLIPDYHPIVVTSNSILFENNRYYYLPKADFKTCSRILMPEIETYQRLGWVNVRSNELWGLEEVDLIDAVQPSAPTYDIGLYSSGFWARTANGWRVFDLDLIRSGKLQENRWYHIFLDMITVVEGLKRDNPSLKVKVYPHPFELELLSKHNLRPPYADRCLAAGFDVQLEGKGSLDAFYESKIGASSQSTIVFDRMHYGLENYYYAGKEHWMSVEASYLGEYQRFGFYTMDDFDQKLRNSLGMAPRTAEGV